MAIANKSSACTLRLEPDAPGETQRPGGMALTERALTQCVLPRNAYVVDIGCGSATTVQHLKADYGYFAVGVDANYARLKIARNRRPDTALICGLGSQLPFPNDWVDGVLAECSLSIMGDFSALLGEFRRILKPGGYLIVSDIYARNPQEVDALRSLKGECYLKYILTQAELFDLLDRNDYAIRSWEDHSSHLRGFSLQRAMTFCPASRSKVSRSTSVGEPDALDLQLALSRARLGYYLLTAQRESFY